MARLLLLLLLTLPMCGQDARTAQRPFHTPAISANTRRLNTLADEMTFAAGVGRGHLHFRVDEFIHPRRSSVALWSLQCHGGRATMAFFGGKSIRHVLHRVNGF